MEIVTSWSLEATELLVLRQLIHRFGELPARLKRRVERLDYYQLQDLGEALLDFTTIADLRHWLDRPA